MRPSTSSRKQRVTLLTFIEVLSPGPLRFQDYPKDSEHFYMDVLDTWDCTLRVMVSAHNAS